MQKLISNKNIISVLFLTFLLALNSCGIWNPASSKKVPTNAQERVQKNMDEGKGFRLGNLGRKSGGDFQFASSNPLWRSALEKLNFAPLANVDYAGGIIVTDWFNDGNSNEQIKITIRFLTNEIRSDSLNVIIHKKVCNDKNNCKISNVENTLNSEIRFAILKKAAQLEKESLSAKKKDNKNYKLPKNY